MSKPRRSSHGVRSAKVGPLALVFENQPRNLNTQKKNYLYVKAQYI